MTPWFFGVTVTFGFISRSLRPLMTLWPFGVINFVMFPFSLSSFSWKCFFSYTKHSASQFGFGTFFTKFSFLFRGLGRPPCRVPYRFNSSYTYISLKFCESLKFFFTVFTEKFPQIRLLNYVKRRTNKMFYTHMQFLGKLWIKSQKPTLATTVSIARISSFQYSSIIHLGREGYIADRNWNMYQTYSTNSQ